MKMVDKQNFLDRMDVKGWCDFCESVARTKCSLVESHYGDIC